MAFSKETRNFINDSIYQTKIFLDQQAESVINTKLIIKPRMNFDAYKNAFKEVKEPKCEIENPSELFVTNKKNLSQIDKLYVLPPILEITKKRNLHHSLQTRKHLTPFNADRKSVV